MIVTFMGILAIAAGILMAAAPQRIVDWMKSLEPRRRFGLAIGVRVVIGAIFLLVAPSCRLPAVVQAVGIIALVAAVAILAMGQTRLDALIDWWIERSAAFMRGVSVFQLGFGALLVYAGGA